MVSLQKMLVSSVFRHAGITVALLLIVTGSKVWSQNITPRTTNTGPYHGFYKGETLSGIKKWRIQSRIDFSRTPSQVIAGKHVGYSTWIRPSTANTVKYVDIKVPVVGYGCLDWIAYASSGVEFYEHLNSTSYNKINAGTSWPRVRIKVTGETGTLRISATETNSTRVFSFVLEELGNTETCQVGGVAYVEL